MKKPRRIALVGTAPSSVHAPFNDESWEIWGVGFRGAHVTRATRWYEIHRLDGESPEWAAEWRAHVKTHDCPIWMFYPENLGPEVIEYPVGRISKRFGTFFQTSTFSWMAAQAIDELRPLDGDPVEGEIGFWGVDMEYGTEYAQQRAGLRHFVEIARFAGIKVTRLATSGIAYDPTPYPLIQDDPLLQKIAHRKGALANDKHLRERSLAATLDRLSQIQAVSDEFRGLLESYEQLPPTAKWRLHCEDRLGKLSTEQDGLESTLPKIREYISWANGASENLEWTEGFLRP